MGLGSLLTVSVVAGAAYYGARKLMEDNPRLDALPAPVRAPVVAVRHRLLRARERAHIALQEGRLERTEAEAELMAEYHRKAGRLPPLETPRLPARLP